MNECCGTLGTAVNETYFALLSVGAHPTGMTPRTRSYTAKDPEGKYYRSHSTINLICVSHIF